MTATNKGSSKPMYHSTILSAVLVSAIAGRFSMAEDWVQWAGNDRQCNWTETGILKKFPPDGLKIRWRTPIGSGYAGPVVSEGRVFTLDYVKKPGTTILEAIERVVCLDEQSGKILWTHEWETHYRRQMQSYATGPRATPAVDGVRVYTLGATGRIHCLDVKDGKVIWERDCVEEYDTTIPVYAVSCSPLVDGERVIYVTGGEGGQVKAFDKRTGKRIWGSLPTSYEMPYSSPAIVEAGGVRQLIVWDQRAVHSLNPETGEVHWSQPFRARANMTIARPIKSGPYLLISSFYTGSMLLELDDQKPDVELVWKVGGTGERPHQTEGLHAVITTPIIEGDYFYGTCSYGELRGLSLKTSERLWENRDFTRQGRWGSMFWVKNEDRYFVNNGVGELIIMQFTPKGPVEIDRTKLIEPDTNCGYGPRRFGEAMVNWVQPAYANRHIIIRNRPRNPPGLVGSVGIAPSGTATSIHSILYVGLPRNSRPTGGNGCPVV